VQIVAAVQLHVRARNAKRQFVERDDAALQLKAALHTGDYLVDPLVPRLSLSTPAQAIDLVLDLRFQEVSIGDVEAPIEPQLVLHFSIQVRNLHLGFEIERAFHEGLALHGQAQDVPHAPLWHVYVELDGAVTVAFVLEDGAARGKARGSESGLDGLEDRVSVGAVHQYLELRAHRDGVSGALEPEIRHVGFAARGDGIQGAFEASLRLQNAGHHRKNAQVRVVERVVAMQRGIARSRGVPGTEGAGTVDFARRLGVGELARVLHRPPGTRRFQLQIVDVEAHRLLRLVLRHDDQRGLLHLHSVHDHRGSRTRLAPGGLGGTLAGAQIGALALGRNGDFQTCDGD